jgi:hypothetical protein
MKRIALVVAFIVVGCGKKKEEPKAPPPTPAVASGSAPAAPAIDTAKPEPKLELLPAKLGAKDGVVFAEKAGDQVAASTEKGGGTVNVPDLTRVEIVEEGEPAAGSGEDVAVKVKYEGVTIAIRADRVISETALSRSPDGKHAVFNTIFSCGDLCHSVFYLLGADGKRTKVGEGGPDVAVSWGKDAVAIGSGSLTVVTLADGAAKTHDKYTSPAYAPDGTLYVRDASGAAFTLVGDKATRVWKPKKKKAAPSEDDMEEPDPDPVTFDKDGKPKFE